MLATALIQPEQLERILGQLPIAADWIGLRWVREVDDVRSMRDGLPQSNGRTINQGLMVEVLVNGQMGYGATNVLSLDGISAAAQAAIGKRLGPSPTDCISGRSIGVPRWLVNIPRLRHRK
jgi:predicted Zn-dependent protease